MTAGVWQIIGDDFHELAVTEQHTVSGSLAIA
jgi:hypothetical protein